VLTIAFPKLAIENVGKKIPLLTSTSSTAKGKKTIKS
jgi:hypothetical protein